MNKYSTIDRIQIEIKDPVNVDDFFRFLNKSMNGTLKISTS